MSHGAVTQAGHYVKLAGGVVTVLAKDGLIIGLLKQQQTGSDTSMLVSRVWVISGFLLRTSESPISVQFTRPLYGSNYTTD